MIGWMHTEFRHEFTTGILGLPFHASYSHESIW